MNRLITSYGIEDGDIYQRSDGGKEKVEVVDTTTYYDRDDVVVKVVGSEDTFKIDAFKLHHVRYSKV